MYLKSCMKYSFSLLEKSTLWSFELLKRICKLFMLLYIWSDWGFTKEKYGSNIIPEQNLWFFYSPQKGQQNQEFFTFPYPSSYGQVHTNHPEPRQKLNYMNSPWPAVKSMLYTHTKYFSFFFFSLVQQLRQSTTTLVF